MVSTASKPNLDSVNERNDLVSPAPPKKVSFIRRAAEILCAFLVCIGLLETSFAFAGLGEEEFLRPNAQIGFEIIPNKNITFRREGFSRTHFNSLGMSDKERTVAKAAGTKRIAVIGDSIVEALQVEQDERMCCVLEKSLNKKYRDPIEVLNFGLSATHIGQSYLRLKDIVVDKFQPDLVVLFFRHHATYDMIPQTKEGFPKACRPYFFVVNNKPVADYVVMSSWQKTGEAKRICRTGWLREYSHIWGVVGMLSQQFAIASKTLWQGPAMTSAPSTRSEPSANSAASASTTPTAEATPGPSVYTKAVEDENAEKCIQCYYPIVDSLVSEMGQLCREKHVQFVVAYLPFDQDKASRLEKDLLKKTCANASIKMIDLGEALAKHHTDKSQKLYITSHFSKYGNAVLAKAMESELPVDLLVNSASTHK